MLQAKEYVARHEGALQERFAMSRSTKDLWARFKILLAAVNGHDHWFALNVRLFQFILFVCYMEPRGNTAMATL